MHPGYEVARSWNLRGLTSIVVTEPYVAFAYDTISVALLTPNQQRHPGWVICTYGIAHYLIETDSVIISSWRPPRHDTAHSRGVFFNYES